MKSKIDHVLIVSSEEIKLLFVTHKFYADDLKS
jgi:hypothetical protein